MSRSYKKYPCIKDCSKHGKRFANKRVRRTKDIPDGKAYRKVYNPWDISDWSFSKTWNEYWREQIQDWELRELPYYAWSNNPRGYCAAWSFRKQPETHWSKQDPRLHEKKHRGLWRLSYCKK